MLHSPKIAKYNHQHFKVEHMQANEHISLIDTFLIRPLGYLIIDRKRKSSLAAINQLGKRRKHQQIHQSMECRSPSAPVLRQAIIQSTGNPSRNRLIVIRNLSDLSHLIHKMKVTRPLCLALSHFIFSLCPFPSFHLSSSAFISPLPTQAVQLSCTMTHTNNSSPRVYHSSPLYHYLSEQQSRHTILTILLGVQKVPPRHHQRLSLSDTSGTFPPKPTFWSCHYWCRLVFDY